MGCRALGVLFIHAVPCIIAVHTNCKAWRGLASVRSMSMGAIFMNACS